MLRQQSPIRVKTMDPGTEMSTLRDGNSKETYFASKESHVCQESPMLRQKSPNCVRTMADGTEMSTMRDGNSKEPYAASKEYHVCQKRPIWRQKSPIRVKTALCCVKRVPIVSKQWQMGRR